MIGMMRRARSVVLAGALGVVLPALALAYDKPAGGPVGPRNPAADWDHLWNHVLIDLLVIGAIFSVAAIWMMIRYRARNADDVGQAKPLTRAQAIGWALIPAAIFMADDFFLAANGWVLWNTQRTVPVNALEVRLTAHQFFWEWDYGNGVVLDSSEEFPVPQGRPVVLRMSSDDVIHSFFIPKFRVKEDVMPGRKTYLWFLPTEVGKVIATCTEFCGVMHSHMPATINVLPEAEFNTWLKSKSKQASAGSGPNS